MKADEAHNRTLPPIEETAKGLFFYFYSYASLRISVILLLPYKHG